ncbi:hypothetical protein [Spirosoma validum]|nr:hypothetical protein [Spirosoma validum]
MKTMIYRIVLLCLLANLPPRQIVDQPIKDGVLETRISPAN